MKEIPQAPEPIQGDFSENYDKISDEEPKEVLQFPAGGNVMGREMGQYLASHEMAVKGFELGAPKNVKAREWGAAANKAILDMAFHFAAGSKQIPEKDFTKERLEAKKINNPELMELILKSDQTAWDENPARYLALCKEMELRAYHPEGTDEIG